MTTRTRPMNLQEIKESVSQRLKDLESELLSDIDATVVAIERTSAEPPTMSVESDPAVSALFHRLWTRDVGTDGYDKESWMLLRAALLDRGLDV